MKKIICLLMVIVMISGFPSEAAAAEDFSHVHKELPFSAGKKAGSYSLITRASCSRARLIAARTSRGAVYTESAGCSHGRSGYCHFRNTIQDVITYQSDCCGYTYTYTFPVYQGPWTCKKIWEPAPESSLFWRRISDGLKSGAVSARHHPAIRAGEVITITGM